MNLKLANAPAINTPVAVIMADTVPDTATHGGTAAGAVVAAGAAGDAVKTAANIRQM